MPDTERIVRLRIAGGVPNCRLMKIFAAIVVDVPHVFGGSMSEQTLDLREIPPPERHPKIFQAFDDLDSGEALTIINDHEPAPLYHQMVAEVDSFDADGYSVDEVGPQEFIAILPKE